MIKFLTTALVGLGVSASSAAFADHYARGTEHVMLGLPDHGQITPRGGAGRCQSRRFLRGQDGCRDFRRRQNRASRR